MGPITQEADSVEVEIFGQMCNLRTDPERGIGPDYILKLAQYVDSRIRVLADETHTANSTYLPNSTYLAVLAAVRIANECHLLKAKLEGEKKESGEEETTEQADSSNSLVGEVDQAQKSFTQEDRQRTRERRRRHHTRRWYEKQLLAIANGELNPTKEQHKALIAFGRLKGWNRRPRQR